MKLLMTPPPKKKRNKIKKTDYNNKIKSIKMIH